MRPLGNEAVIQAHCASGGWVGYLWQEHPYLRLVVLQLERTSESSGRFDETQVAGAHRRISESGLRWDWECASLTSSHPGQSLSAQGPQLKTPAKASVRSTRRSNVPSIPQEREERLGKSGQEPSKGSRSQARGPGT